MESKSKELPPPYDGVPQLQPEHFDKSHAKGQENTAEQGPVTVTPATVVVVGTEPIRTTCGQCHMEIITFVRYTNSRKTHCWGACLCLLGGLLLAWIPYFKKSCKNANHYCPNCQAYIGTHFYK